MKLNPQLFNAVLEQVRHRGPDNDCVTEMTWLFAQDSKEFMAFLQQSVRQVKQDDLAGVFATFQLGFESGLQYAKVSREVEELNKSL